MNHQFSAKPQPTGRYDDYYHQVSTYCMILGGPAAEIDPTATARCFAPIVPDAEEDSPFHYLDTASSRSEICQISKKLAIGKVAIIGLGGTGAYVLDLVAKTPVREIHLFDKDWFLSHNAFRGPGAASIEELRAKPLKVEYFARIYSGMHRGIIAHPVHVDNENIELLRGMDFVFLCIDDGMAKRFIIRELEDFGISFIDVGMGLYVGDDGLGGMIRVTIEHAGAAGPFSLARFPRCGGRRERVRPEYSGCRPQCAERVDGGNQVEEDCWAFTWTFSMNAKAPTELKCNC